MSVRGTSNITTCVSGPGLNPRSRTRGGLVRGTARTTRSLPCRPGPVPIATTAATRHLCLHSRSRHSSLALILPRVARLKLHTIAFTFIPGDAAACSRMATDISRVYSDLTHAVLTHGRSLTHRASYTHSTPAGALTRGVSHTRGGLHTRAVSGAHAVSTPAVPL